MRRTRLGGGLAIAALLVLTACAGADDPGADSAAEAATTGEVTTPVDDGGDSTPSDTMETPEGEPVRLVFLTNQSGVFSALSEGSVQGVEAKVDAVNASGGVLGRPLELEIIDTESDATRATAVAEGIQASDDLMGVVGPEGTATCFAVRAVLIEKGIVHYCSTGAPIPGGSDGLIPGDFSPYYFALGAPPVLANGEATVSWMEEQGFESIAVISSSDASGQLYGGIINRVAEGRKDIVANETFDATAPDVTPQMTTIRAADPDVIYVGTTGAGLATVLQSVQDLGIDAPIWAGYGNASTTVAELVADLLPPGGLYSYGEAIHVYDELSGEDTQVQQLREAHELWQEEYGEELGLDAAGMWDAITNLVTAAEGAGEVGPDEIVEWLESGEKIVGLAGIYQFGPDDHRGTQSSNLVISFTPEGSFALEDTLDAP